MYTGQMVFSQLMDFLPRHEFNQCVRRYQGNYRVRKFSCLDQFLCMVFAQFTYRESLRDTETCLRAVESKLYHAGIRGRVSRSTLADANESRDWRIWADFAQVLVGRARQLYAGEDFGLALQQSAYALDSTNIDLCLSLFPLAIFNKAFSYTFIINTLRGTQDRHVQGRRGRGYCSHPGQCHDDHRSDPLPRLAVESNTNPLRNGHGTEPRGTPTAASRAPQGRATAAPRALPPSLKISGHRAGGARSKEGRFSGMARASPSRIR